MRCVKRDLNQVIESKIGKGKVIVITGPRQVGKTTLLKSMVESFPEEKHVQFWNCDEPDIRSLLADASSVRLKSIIGKSEFIVIDEAQRVKNIGLTIKLIHDNFPDVQLAVTGLHSYSRNVRNELKKSIKIYFYDNGIRNAVISNFLPCELRSDNGILWENFLISERIKNNIFHNIKAKYYFWRTTQKQEVDFLEEIEGKISSWEFKYNPKKAGSRCPLTFSNNYPDIPFSVITPDNYIDFVTSE